MSWSERLEDLKKTQDRPSCSPAKGSKGTFAGFAGEQKEHMSDFSRMPSKAELERICRRATAEYPSVEPGRLRRFLEVAEDPAWCSEPVARHIAKRMQRGLIGEGEQ